MIETQMLIKLKDRSEDALEWFIHHYTPYVSTIIYNIIGSSMAIADIEEVTSDVFFAFWQHADDIQPNHVQGYLAVTARNKAKNKCREIGCNIPLEDQVIVLNELSPERQLQQKELSMVVRKAVLDMADVDREIFLRFYFYYQNIEQISADLQMNPSTVKTKLRRGRERLKQSLSKYIE